MISIERVKQLLADPAISDEEAENIRNGFQALVEDVIFPSWLEERNKRKGGNENKPRDDTPDICKCEICTSQD